MTRFAIRSSIGRADEDDAVLQQPREDVVGAFATVGLLDHHGYELIRARGSNRIMVESLIGRGKSPCGVLRTSRDCSTRHREVN